MITFIQADKLLVVEKRPRNGMMKRTQRWRLRIRIGVKKDEQKWRGREEEKTGNKEEDEGR